MDLHFFLRGIVLGFSIAAPVGPIGVLCIHRTLAGGRAVGLVSGLGAASADAIYGSIAAFGLAAVSGFLVDQQTWLQLIGGAFLLFLGLRTIRAQPAERAAEAQAGHGLPGAYLSTLALTLTNPVTILSFVAIFAGAGIVQSGTDYAAALTLVVGVFIGSALWWLLLSGGVSLVRTAFTPARLRWVNRLSGAVLVVFGVLALAAAAV